MTTGTRVHRRIVSRKYRSAPYPLPSCNCEGIDKDMHQKKCSKTLEKEDWEDATCAVCLEYPHNAVLLLCSSHDKGCRPYMCATSYRYSNCLDQYEKANKKESSPHHGQPLQGSAEYTSVGFGSEWPAQKCEGMELACPLCRGQVKGWTVVEAARKYLNAKKRTCMQDNCSFVGTYRELRKHVKQEHPSARPREVDPILEQKWKNLERERERDDVMSTIRSSMPGAMVLGDYVIERNHHNFNSDDDEGAEEDGENYQMGFDNRGLLDVIFVLQTFEQRRNGRMNTGRRELHYHDLLNGEGVRRGPSPSSTSHGTASPEGEEDNISALARYHGGVVSPRRTGRLRGRRALQAIRARNAFQE